MKNTRRFRLPFLLSAIFLPLTLSASGVLAAPKPMTAAAPVKVAMAAKFGDILATPKNQAIYYWTPEKGGKVKCTSSCAAQWPPVLVGKNAMIPHSIKGLMGTFGEVTRPDGTHQLTFDKWPLYTFVADKAPLQVLCDGVNGWHVFRVMH